MSGHLFGVAGGIEAISTLKSIMEEIGLSTINYYNLNEECELNYVPNEAVKMEINDALSNGRGFGGHNAVLTFNKIIK